MKTIKLSLIAFALFAFCGNSFSQYEENNNINNENPIKSKHALGLAAGVSTGYGLSYQYTPIEKLTFQLAFAPFKDDYSTLISSGLTFIYRLKEGDKLNFFVYQANHYIVDRTNNNLYAPNGPQTINNDRFNNGLGFGFEFFIGDNVLFDLMGGYGARNNFNELGLTGEIGLFYKL